MSMCTSDADQALQNRANARSTREGWPRQEDWVDDAGEFPRNYAGDFIAWLLTPVVWIVEKIAERFGWW